MLIRSNQLTLNESTSILDSGVYLTEAEAALNPVAVPYPISFKLKYPF